MVIALLIYIAIVVTLLAIVVFWRPGKEDREPEDIEVIKKLTIDLSDSTDELKDAVVKNTPPPQPSIKPKHKR